MAETFGAEMGMPPQPGRLYIEVLAAEKLCAQDNYGNGEAVPYCTVLLAGLAHRLGLVPWAEAESNRLARSGHSAVVVRRKEEDSGPAESVEGDGREPADPIVAYWTYGRRSWWRGRSVTVTGAVVDPEHDYARTDPLVLGTLAALGLRLPEESA